jgi:N utilization substance protein A
MAMNSELQAVLEYMERERGIQRETMIQAVEAALLSASKKSVGPARELRIEIDRNSLDIKAFANLEVVENARNKHEQIAFKKARLIKPDVQLGDVVEVEVTPKNFGRIAAQTAKQAILQKIRQAERERVFEEFKDRPGDVVTGAVRRFDRSDVIVDLGRAEGIMPSRQRVPTEEYQIGERIRALIINVENKPSGTEVVLSRSDPEFVRRLFEIEVSEIADHTVEIKGIAREEKVDPVGACVGMRGIRVKNIVRELSGEKIDIVRWHDDTRTFVTNALAPAKLRKVAVDEAMHTVRVLVDPDQLSLAIGKKGQNARLTAKLTGWKIDIQKEEEALGFVEKVAKAIADLAKVEGIGVQRAEALVHAGFLTVEGILAADIDDIAAIDGLSAEIANEIHVAAEAAYEKEHGPIVE